MNRYWLVGMGMGAILLAGCAAPAARQDVGQAPPAASAQQDREAKCRAAIDEVGRYCSGEGYSQGKCDRAKAHSTEFCL